MFLLAIVLNLITIAIVAAFAIVIYMAYRKRDDPSVMPLDVMTDIISGQAGHSRIYKVRPFKYMLTGPIGNFKPHKDEDREYSNLNGNSYDYIYGRKPWQGVSTGIGTYSGISSSKFAN